MLLERDGIHLCLPYMAIMTPRHQVGALVEGWQLELASTPTDEVLAPGTAIVVQVCHVCDACDRSMALPHMARGAVTMVVQGSSNSSMNGKQGVVVEYSAKHERYAVDLQANDAHLTRF